MLSLMTTTEQLTPRQGKVLRYVTSTATLPVLAARLVNSIEWSDLPHDLLQARAALEKLRRLGLVQRDGNGLRAHRERVHTHHQRKQARALAGLVLL
jgi:hypothetical protein